MDNKIQELAEKIYKDGVEKANSQAEQIVAKAESQGRDALEKAKSEAERIVTEAREEAERLKTQSETEVRNMVSSAEDALQLKITSLINSAAVNKAIDAAFAKPEALYGVVLQMAKQLSGGVEISTSDAKGLEEYFRAQAQEVLNQGVKITEVAGKSANFDISPEGADYKINVSKEAFAEYFKEFMRPRMREILFGGE